MKQESISEERPLQPHPGLQPATNTESNPDAILVAPPPLLAASEGATLLISAPLDHNPVTEAALNDEQVPPAEAGTVNEGWALRRGNRSNTRQNICVRFVDRTVYVQSRHALP